MKINTNIFTDYDKTIIKQKYEEILSLIEYILIESTSSLQFFGYFFMGMEKKLLYVDSPELYSEIKGIESTLVFIDKNNILTFIVDPEVLYNDKCIFKITFKILHELLHSILKHNSRKPNDIIDAIVFNLAADQIVNSILYELHNNKQITKLTYFSENEFFIKRMYNNNNLNSTEQIMDYINTSNEFEVSAKKITIPIEFTSDNPPTELPKILVEDILTKTTIQNYNQKQLNQLFNKTQINDNEFNLNINKQNTYIDDSLYIKTTFNTFFKDKTDSNNVVDNFNESDMLQDLLNNNSINSISDTNNNGNLSGYICLSFIIIHVFDKLTNKSYEVIYDLESQSSQSEQIEKESSSQYKKHQNDLENVLNKRNSYYGNSSFDALSFLNSLFDVKYPWDVILQNSILTRAKQSEDRSYSIYDNYRNHLSKVRFPGYMTEMTPEILCIAIDSSASMSEEDLKKIASVICDSHGKYSETIIFIHDVKVKQTIYILEHDTKEQIFQKIKSIKGRGGTSHKDVFTHIQDLLQEKIISTLIFFTDFDSDVKHIYKDFEFLNLMQSIWCISGKSKEFVVDLPIPTITINIESTIIK